MRNAVYLNSCSRAGFYTVNGLPFTILQLSEKLIHPSILTTRDKRYLCYCMPKQENIPYTLSASADMIPHVNCSTVN